MGEVEEVCQGTQVEGWRWQLLHAPTAQVLAAMFVPPVNYLEMLVGCHLQSRENRVGFHVVEMFVTTPTSHHGVHLMAPIRVCEVRCPCLLRCEVWWGAGIMRIYRTYISCAIGGNTAGQEGGALHSQYRSGCRTERVLCSALPCIMIKIVYACIGCVKQRRKYIKALEITSRHVTTLDTALIHGYMGLGNLI